ncbi:MAG: hypothetical protein ACSHW9_03240 [Salinibacterium amurskyense]
MKITVPNGYGKSQRNSLVGQFSVDWAAGNVASLRPLFADDLRWEVVGEPERDAESRRLLPENVRENEVFIAINHGRASSGKGRMLTVTGWVDFCHVLRFSGVVKAAHNLREKNT